MDFNCCIRVSLSSLFLPTLFSCRVTRMFIAGACSRHHDNDFDGYPPSCPPGDWNVMNTSSSTCERIFGLGKSFSSHMVPHLELLLVCLVDYGRHNKAPMLMETPWARGQHLNPSFRMQQCHQTSEFHKGTTHSTRARYAMTVSKVIPLSPHPSICLSHKCSQCGVTDRRRA